MQITIYNLKHPNDLTEQEIIDYAIAKYQIATNDFMNGILVKKSLDFRDKNKPVYVYQLVFELTKNSKKNKKLLNKNIEFNTKYTDELKINRVNSNIRPIVVGFGPAGMFSSYLLAKAGLKPIIFERGSTIDERILSVNKFFDSGVFEENNNVCFGEGGAGTFSDGKLNTSLSDEKIRFILKTFTHFGADSSVYYDSKPHVGTDKIREVVKNLRNEIINLGGEFHFNSLVSNVKTNKVEVLENGNVSIYHSPFIILAIGHSARETYEMLFSNGFILEPKPFSMGVRIEHLQDKINNIQYGDFKASYAAPYKAWAHLENRDVYTFCMCPGGYVVSSNSYPKEIVTNGMSYSNRNGSNANSALLVNVKIDDYFKENPLDGLKFQEKYEKLCYNVSSSYKAPCNLLKEFMNDDVACEFRTVKPTYPNGTVFTSFDGLLPKFVIDSLKEGIKEIDKKMKGFMDDDAILTAVESRSSSPIRIKRNEFYESNISGVYPIGEGAGYAGGITSSALDGIKCALQIIKKIKEETLYES